jgi:hypothetical protein
MSAWIGAALAEPAQIPLTATTVEASSIERPVITNSIC